VDGVKHSTHTRVRTMVRLRPTWPASSSRSSSIKSGNHLRSTIRNIAGNHFLPSQELIQLIQPFVAAQ
jgi:hypothetical protein